MKDKAKIDYIIKHFDFEKMHNVMKFLGWTYHGKDIPNVNMLKKKATELLIDLSRKPDSTYSVTTGGFRASRQIYQERSRSPIVIYKLDFIVTTQDNWLLLNENNFNSD